MMFTDDPEDRKKYPIATGVLDYFPLAIAEVARVSFAGNEQHHPGSPLHWDRSKSTDEADALMRHFVERGTRDSDGMRHSAKAAWRALALLQKEIETERRWKQDFERRESLAIKAVIDRMDDEVEARIFGTSLVNDAKAGMKL